MRGEGPQLDAAPLEDNKGAELLHLQKLRTFCRYSVVCASSLSISETARVKAWIRCLARVIWDL